jgi:hypothetical protein
MAGAGDEIRVQMQCYDQSAGQKSKQQLLATGGRHEALSIHLMCSGPLSLLEEVLQCPLSAQTPDCLVRSALLQHLCIHWLPDWWLCTGTARVTLQDNLQPPVPQTAPNSLSWHPQVGAVPWSVF